MCQLLLKRLTFKKYSRLMNNALASYLLLKIIVKRFSEECEAESYHTSKSTFNNN